MMNEKRKKEIKGTLVSLKQLHPDFFNEYHAMFSTTVRSILHLSDDQTLDQTKQFLSEQIKKDQVGQILFYCIFDNTDDCLIGGIEIRSVCDPDNGQLGNWLNENYWGGGRYQQALDMTVREYFRLNTDQEMIIACVDATNERSYRALLKYGFEKTGTRQGKHGQQVVMKFYQELAGYL